MVRYNSSLFGVRNARQFRNMVTHYRVRAGFQVVAVHEAGDELVIDEFQNTHDAELRAASKNWLLAESKGECVFPHQGLRY